MVGENIYRLPVKITPALRLEMRGDFRIEDQTHERAEIPIGFHPAAGLGPEGHLFLGEIVHGDDLVMFLVLVIAEFLGHLDLGVPGFVGALGEKVLCGANAGEVGQALKVAAGEPGDGLQNALLLVRVGRRLAPRASGGQRQAD